MAQKKKTSSKSHIDKVIIMGVVAIVILVGFVFLKYKDNGEEVQGGNKQNVTLSADGDLIIPIEEVSETASFYPVEIDGTSLEVLAVKASDGTIRTAFNTCQICYSSGRGYYEQSGNMLICQNCGNRFGMDDVEVVRGGCNPVPIFEEDKQVDEENITITNEFLTEAKGIFANWKNGY